MDSSISLLPVTPGHGTVRSRDEDAGYGPISPLLPTNDPGRPPTGNSLHDFKGANDGEIPAYTHKNTRSKSIRHWSIPSSWRTRFRFIYKRIPTGWKLGTTGAALLTAVILVINISITAVSYAKIREKAYKTSVAPIRTGNCKDIKESGVLIHLAINVASTLLLGASSYCMQSVSAPTREDVDAAHAKDAHLDIGIPSYRNLRFIKRRRLFVWLCLCLSSVPLHLVYNSTFFVSTNNNVYPIYYADESFAKGAPFNETFLEYYDSYRWDGIDDIKQIQQDLVAGSRFQNLSNNDCIKAYAKTLVEDRSRVILVVDRPENCSIFQDTWQSRPPFRVSAYEDCGNISATSLYDTTEYTRGIQPEMSPLVNNWFYWICDQQNAYRYDGVEIGDETYDKPPNNLCSDGGWKDQLNADPWIVSGARVRYCLSEKVSKQCNLNVAVNLLWVVVSFNLVKLVITGFLVWSSLINSNPLVTIGDAAASFIEYPDSKTERMCLYTAEDMKGLQKERAIFPVRYQHSRPKWSAAVSKLRWILASILTFLALAVILGLLGYAANILQRYFNRGSITSLWGFGFGAITPYTLISGWAIPTRGDAAVVATVLIANLPQLLLSFLYLILNSLVTSMALSAEWARFAHQRRALRVSFPLGDQRSTYFLQLPYRLSIPLLAFSTLLHWLVSQSIFIAQVNDISPGEEDLNPAELSDGDVITTCAYSPMAMILTCFAIVLLFASALLLGRKRLVPGIPLAASSSMTISAACHAPEGTSSLLPVKWGEIPVFEENGEEFGVRHCSFSNGNVGFPVQGMLYA